MVRLHVPPGAAVASATVDGTEASSFATLEPIVGAGSAAHRPFGGAGAPPAAGAGAKRTGATTPPAGLTGARRSSTLRG